MQNSNWRSFVPDDSKFTFNEASAVPVKARSRPSVVTILRRMINI